MLIIAEVQILESGRDGRDGTRQSILVGEDPGDGIAHQRGAEAVAPVQARRQGWGRWRQAQVQHGLGHGTELLPKLGPGRGLGQHPPEAVADPRRGYPQR
ncbi:hypothetical protein DAT35_40285 [Vitiosangium sp. GDMCC 1.1324]|nr:hypothetical protein DAT35_40285 [Vitiosangium sp. GDMCC 1.1324]